MTVAEPAADRPPLSSAKREGTELIDVTKHGYVEEEFYLQDIAPAIIVAGESLFDAPYCL